MVAALFLSSAVFVAAKDSLSRAVWSHIPLHGADAPRTISLEIRRVPGGDYDVRSALINRVGRERAAVAHTGHRSPVSGQRAAGSGQRVTA
jgi:hypothetical protein